MLQEPASQPCSGITIVLCGDDSDQNMQLRRDVFMANGLEVLVPREPVETVRMVCDSRVQAVVIAFSLPHPDVPTVLRLVKSARPSVPILLLGIPSSPPPAAAGAIHGYVQKLDGPEKLVSVLMAMIAPRSMAAAAASSSSR